MCDISFHQPLRLCSFLILLRLVRPFCFGTSNERKVNAKWTHGKRFVNGERERSGAGNASERTVTARWTHENGKVKDFRDCIECKLSWIDLHYIGDYTYPDHMWSLSILVYNLLHTAQ